MVEESSSCPVFIGCYPRLRRWP